MTVFYEYKNGAVIIGTDAGLFLTTDHGRTFKKAITPANYINVITGDQSENIFLGTASGLFRSKDTCKTWSRMNVVLPGDNVNSISFDSKGNTYETSTYDLSVSTDHGDTWTSWKSKLVAPGDIFMVHWIILDKDIIYLYGTYIGLIFSQDMGNSWKQISTRWRDSTGTTIGFNPNGIYIDSKSYIYTRDASYVTIHKVYRGSITPTAVETNNTIIEPTEFRLYQNYPNPFNPSTTIKYSIPVDPATAGRHAVSLQVYDLLGREIATLVNGEKSPGNYEVKLDGTGLTSCVYFYTLRVGDFVQTKKMMLIK
jgi:photosystem II stability/assembly factor-like uncharacterized protein